VTALFEVGAADVASTNDEWYTPRWIFDAAGLTFDLDVCAPVAPEFRTCPARRYLTVLDDGLIAPWNGLVWMNPPYSNSGPWVERFIRHGEGLALVPAANSSWRGPLMRCADGVALVSVSTKLARPSIGSRLSSGFGRPDGSQVGYPVALILAARGERAVSALEPVAMTDPYAAGAYHVRPVTP
jgi:DNA N-6-adenine-methyltransferase (Dam)